MASLTLRGITKRYDDTEVMRNINLDIADGEFVVFVGPSGCGKSTLMRMIAGLEDISGGDLTIDGTRMNEVPPAKRGIAMVFQSYALYPHMTLYDNMAFGLKLAGTKKPEIDSAVRNAAKILHIDHLLDRKPKQLSGGQRQRVAIGRAITRKPKVFLFDEPLSNLDAALRVKMRLEFARLHDELKTTMIYVTHDQVEAMTLADRVVVLRDGQIEQVGTPLELYDRPANQFVAQFIGTPQMNVIAADVVPQFEAVLGLKVPAGGFIGMRPESVTLTSSGSGQLQARVELVESLGAETLIHVATDRGAQFVSRQNSRSDLNAGDDVGIAFDAAAAHLFDAQGRVSRNASLSAN